MSTKKFTMIASVLFALSVIVTPAFAACDLAHISDPVICDEAGLLQLAASLGATTTTTTTTTTGSISGIPAGFQFTQTLRQGSTGTQVKYLQILLNSDSATAVGNAGKETTYFGSMTKAAVNKFQAKYASEILAPLGLTAPTGTFGAATRAKANAILAGGIPTGGLPAGCTSTSGYSTVTGLPCSSTGTLPEGCTSTSGYSPTTGQKCDSGSTTPVAGGFSIRLATDNPASGTFVQGQATADLAHYIFSNGTATAVTVTGVELTRIGISADATLSNVYLFDGATRLTDAGTVSAGKVTFNASSGILTIPANSSKTVSVKSDLAGSSSGQTIGVSLSGVTSNGTLVGTTLPIAGNIHSIASATLATVAVGAPLPTLTSPIVATPTDPITGVRIWESTFTINNRDVKFTKLALKQINSINASDVTNFKLLIDGVEVATVAALDANNYITFTFDKTLTTGTRNVKVLADINGGSSRLIQMSLRNKADIDVKDSEYGVNVAVTGAPATANPLSVNSGVFTITTDNSVIPVTVAKSASNVRLAKYTFKATGEAVKVDTLKFGFVYTNVGGGNGGGATLRNGKIMINGSQAGSTSTVAAAGTDFSVNYTFQPGVVTTVELYADIFDNDGTGAIVATDQITAKLVTGAGNGNLLTSLGTINVPTADKSASMVTVASGTATLVKKSNYANQNTVLPRTAYKIGAWSLTGGTSEDINVSNLGFVIAPVSATNFTAADMQDMYVVYTVGTGAPVTTSTRPSPLSTPSSNDFPVSFVLGRTQIVSIELYANLQDNGLNAAGGAATVAATDSVKSTLTITGTGAQSGAAASINGGAGATDGQTIIAQTAALVVTRDASTPVSAIVDDSGSIVTAVYKFDAQNDNYTISQLEYTIDDVSAVANVNLKDGTTLIQSRPAATTVLFNGFAEPLVVTAGVPKLLTIELELTSVGNTSGTSGAHLTTAYSDSANDLVRPSSTGTTENPTDAGAVAGNALYAYKAIPTVSLVSLPSSVLGAGEKTISKFTIATNGTGAIAWKKIIVDVVKTATPTFAANTVKLYDSDTGLEVTGAAAFVGGTDCSGANLLCTVQFAVGTDADDNVEQQISGSKTYELRATIGGAPAANDYINTRILGSGVGHVNPAVYPTGGASGNFIWSDVSALNHDTGTSDWNNDNLVRTIPTTTQSLTK